MSAFAAPARDAHVAETEHAAVVPPLERIEHDPGPHHVVRRVVGLGERAKARRPFASRPGHLRSHLFHRELEDLAGSRRARGLIEREEWYALDRLRPGGAVLRDHARDPERAVVRDHRAADADANSAGGAEIVAAILAAADLEHHVHGPQARRRR
jgi:hypothetical protein